MGQSVDLKTQFSEILRANGIKDKISDVVKSSAPELKGTHMESLIEYATVTFTEKNKEPLELFLKKPMLTGHEVMDKGFTKITVKEGQILTKFVSAMKKACKSKTGTEDPISDLFPRIYHSDDNMIVMDNLAKQNYAMLPKSEKQDVPTAKSVLKQLAGFHGVSYAMIANAGGKDKFSKTYPFIQDFYLDAEAEPIMTQMIDSNIATICKLLESVGAAEDLTLSSLLKRRTGKYFTEILEILKADEIFPVVNHGDFWNCNMMFKNNNKENEAEKKMALVDLQMSRIGSPNLDLGYYIFTSLKPEARKEWKLLLEFYFSHLKATILNLGLKFDFEFENFVRDFQRKSKLGFIFGLFMTIAIDAMDIFDADKANKEGQDLRETLKTMLSDWLEKNPDKRAKACTDIKELVDDYLQFGTL